MESNPMLGLRGCRLGNLYPEITEMQTRAIMEAAVELKEEGINVIPEIMVPLIGIVNEFMAQKRSLSIRFSRYLPKRVILWNIR